MSQKLCIYTYLSRSCPHGPQMENTEYQELIISFSDILDSLREMILNLRERRLNPREMRLNLDGFRLNRIS